MTKNIILFSIISTMTLFLFGCNAIHSTHTPRNETVNAIKKSPKYEEKRVAPNQWLVSINAGIGAEKHEAWAQLYQHIETFSSRQCPKSYRLDNQEIVYKPATEGATYTIAKATIVCVN